MWRVHTDYTYSTSSFRPAILGATPEICLGNVEKYPPPVHHLLAAGNGEPSTVAPGGGERGSCTLFSPKHAIPCGLTNVHSVQNLDPPPLVYTPPALLNARTL